MTRNPPRDALASVYGKQQDRYLELVRGFPLRPIRSEKELDEAIQVVDALVTQKRLSRAEDDYLDVLSDLIEAYEDKHHPIGDVSDADMLRSLMENRDLTQAALAKQVGIAESTISEVLSGKRKLTRAQIGKLAKFFHVEPGAFSFGE